MNVWIFFFFFYFYFQSQLRNHEREQHGISETAVALTPVGETKASMDESEKISDEGESLAIIAVCILFYFFRWQGPGVVF